MPHQRLTCTGFDIASKTRRRGASKSRVRTISRSEGVVALKLSLFATLLTAMFPLLLLRFLLFQFLQIVVEPVEACFPDMPVAFGALGHLLEGTSLQPARPPLRLASARNQARAFEHAEVLRDGGHAHVEGLGEFGDGTFTRDETRQDRAA